MKPAFVAVVGLAAVVAFVLATVSDPVPMDLRQGPRQWPIVPVESAGPAVERQQVQVALTWDHGPAVLASGATGRVTYVAVGVGDEVTSGDVVLNVAGHDVIALISDRAPYRSLAAGDTGPDVTAAARMLVDAGFFDPASWPSTVDWEMSEAILEFNKAHGWQDRVRTQDGTVVGPELAIAALAWSAEPIVDVRAVHVQAGTPAPTAGQPLVQGVPHLTAAQVETSAAAAPEGVRATLIVEGARVPLPTETLTIARPEDLRLLAEHVPVLTERADGVLEIVTSRNAMAVPVGAITRAADGTTCVRGGPSDPWVLVNVVGSRFGQALLRPSEHLPEEVLVDSDPALATCLP